MRYSSVSIRGIAAITGHQRSTQQRAIDAHADQWKTVELAVHPPRAVSAVCVAASMPSPAGPAGRASHRISGPRRPRPLPPGRGPAGCQRDAGCRLPASCRWSAPDRHDAATEAARYRPEFEDAEHLPLRSPWSRRCSTPGGITAARAALSELDQPAEVLGDLPLDPSPFWACVPAARASWPAAGCRVLRLTALAPAEGRTKRELRGRRQQPGEGQIPCRGYRQPGAPPSRRPYCPVNALARHQGFPAGRHAASSPPPHLVPPGPHLQRGCCPDAGHRVCATRRKQPGEARVAPRLRFDALDDPQAVLPAGLQRARRESVSRSRESCREYPRDELPRPRPPFLDQHADRRTPGTVAGVRPIRCRVHQRGPVANLPDRRRTSSPT